MAMPEVDDRVMALLSAENPAVGLVLGSVTGSRGLPDTGIENGAVVRFSLRTPGGHKIELDDAKKCLRFTASGGSYLELGPEQLTLHSATGLLIDASGQALAMKADKIDMRRG
jgi:phage baseplate assembly protein gpV